MLYDFHKSQNDRKPGSIHATYMLYGSEKSEEPSSQMQPDGDVEMSSSPPEIESTAEQVPTMVMSLVNEGQLEGDALSFCMATISTNKSQRCSVTV